MFFGRISGDDGRLFCFSAFGRSLGKTKGFLVSLLLISLGMLCVYFAPSLAWLLVFRFITGLGIGGILPNLATVASEFSTATARDFNVGIVQGGWPLGAILTGFVVAWVFPLLGWRATFLIASAFSFALLILVYFSCRNPLDSSPKRRISTRLGLENFSPLSTERPLCCYGRLFSLAF